jgi:Na+/proline symporter
MLRFFYHSNVVTMFVYLSWGTSAHIVFLFFCFMTNIIVTAMLLLGGSAVVNALTGVNIYAASFLIPLGVIVYTLAGGLKATFLASYIHSVIGRGLNHFLSRIIVLTFCFIRVYLSVKLCISLF